MKTSQKMKQAIIGQFKKQYATQGNLQSLDDPEEMTLWLVKTIHHFFPNLFQHLRQVEDYRRQSDYQLAEILFAGIAMFLFKKGSRNAMNLERTENKFTNNYEKIFNFRLPHLDTVDRVMRKLPENLLEELKTRLLHELINKKIFKNSLLYGYYRVAIDGTHVMNVKEGHCKHCLYSEHKKSGKISWFHNVLEAKLITPWGLCLSLGSEWIENPDSEYDKQDCELKAFARLAEKIKKNHPRLKICIIADGLYPNQTFFRICELIGWKWILTFKNGNLPSVWTQVIQNLNFRFRHVECNDFKYYWFNQLEYEGYRLNWIKGTPIKVQEDKKEHVFVTNLDVSVNRVMELVNSGRGRWKIENEGFNTQKNGGLNLGHQYSRQSIKAVKNYYQCMQIAHIILNLFEKWGAMKASREGRKTIRHLTGKVCGEMRERVLDIQSLEALLAKRFRVIFNN